MPPIPWAASSVLWAPSAGRRAFHLWPPAPVGVGSDRTWSEFSNYSGATRTPRPGGPGRAISILSIYPGRILVDLLDAVSFGPLPSFQVFFVHTI